MLHIDGIERDVVLDKPLADAPRRPPTRSSPAPAAVPATQMLSLFAPRDDRLDIVMSSVVTNIAEPKLDPPVPILFFKRGGSRREGQPRVRASSWPIPTGPQMEEAAEGGSAVRFVVPEFDKRGPRGLCTIYIYGLSALCPRQKMFDPYFRLLR